MLKKKKNKSKVIVVQDKKQSEDFSKSKKNPKSAQDTIPYDEIYDNGVYRIGNTFSVMFEWENINYRNKQDRDKDLSYKQYIHFLSSLPANLNYQEFITNKPHDISALKEAMIPTDKGNEKVNRETLKDYQNIMSGIVNDCIHKSCNQIVIGAISFTPKNKLEDVNVIFKYLNQFEELAMNMNTKITRKTTEETLEILHSVYHSCDSEPFLLPDNFMQHDVKLKDYIAPSHFKFNSKSIEIGSSYSCIMFVKHISKTCDDEFITDLVDNNYKIIVSKHLLKIDKSVSLDILKKQMNDLEMRLEKRREANHKSGGEFIPYSLKNRESELTALQNKLNDSNCDMFQFSIYIMASAPTASELNDLILYIKQKGLTHQVKIDILSGSVYQMKGLRCVLPFANPVLNSEGSFLGQPYYLPTDEVANFIPFSYRNVFVKGGIYYGIDKITRSPVIIDRSQNMNGNSFTLGMSGSGKSMDVKSELYAAMMKYPNDEFFIIDPDNEYRPLADEFDSEIIKISPNATTYLNIFDTDLSYVDEGANAITMKSDFIMTFIEAVQGRPLMAKERSLIDRCVKTIYLPYQKSGDKKDIPTLKDFYEDIKKYDDIQEAKDIALAIELYVHGSFNIFSHKTNVEFHKNFIIFDIFEMSKQLEAVGNLVILELLWQRVIDNKKRGVRTWVWTDEFSVMFNDKNTNAQIFSTGDFFVKVYKRIRKQGGNAAGATQNITEVLESPQAIAMLSNSDFVMLLAQKPSDLKQIVKLWDLSESQTKYLDSDKVGTGLILSGKNVIPFQNLIPADSRMYKVCSTKFADNISTKAD